MEVVLKIFNNLRNQEKTFISRFKILTTDSAEMFSGDPAVLLCAPSKKEQDTRFRVTVLEFFQVLKVIGIPESNIFLLMDGGFGIFEKAQFPLQSRPGFPIQEPNSSPPMLTFSPTKQLFEYLAIKLASISDFLFLGFFDHGSEEVLQFHVSEMSHTSLRPFLTGLNSLGSQVLFFCEACGSGFTMGSLVEKSWEFENVAVITSTSDAGFSWSTKFIVSYHIPLILGNMCSRRYVNSMKNCSQQSLSEFFNTLLQNPIGFSSQLFAADNMKSRKMELFHGSSDPPDGSGFPPEHPYDYFDQEPHQFVIADPQDPHSMKLLSDDLQQAWNTTSHLEEQFSLTDDQLVHILDVMLFGLIPRDHCAAIC
jgi:hypothetical protein